MKPTEAEALKEVMYEELSERMYDHIVEKAKEVRKE